MSVRALNAELGLSHETISKRFGPKLNLFRAAVDYGVGLTPSLIWTANSEKFPAGMISLDCKAWCGHSSSQHREIQRSVNYSFTKAWMNRSVPVSSANLA